MKCHRNMANGRFPFFVIIPYFFDKEEHVFRIIEGQNIDMDNFDDLVSHVQYYLIPANKCARNFVDKPIMVSERDFIALEYKIRRAYCPVELLEGAHNKIINIEKRHPALLPDVVPHTFEFDS